MFSQFSGNQEFNSLQFSFSSVPRKLSLFGGPSSAMLGVSQDQITSTSKAKRSKRDLSIL